MVKSLTIAIVVFMTAAFSLYLRSEPRSDLQAELLEMRRIDQEVRGRFMALIQQGGPDVLSTDDFRVLAEEMNAIDRANVARLGEIVELVGWPGVSMVGDEAADAASLIVVHASRDQQKEYLPALRQAVSEGQLSASSLATIEDDLALADSGKQVYGTEIILESGRAVLAPVAEPEEIDERRTSIGLPPIDAYLEIIEAELGMTVDQSALMRD